jgi:hypothetical protein
LVGRLEAARTTAERAVNESRSQPLEGDLEQASLTIRSRWGFEPALPESGLPRAWLPRPIDAGVQVAAVVVVGEEGVQIGQQAHRREPSQGVGVRETATRRSAGEV